MTRKCLVCLSVRPFITPENCIFGLDGEEARSSRFLDLVLGELAEDLGFDDDGHLREVSLAQNLEEAL